MGLERVEVADLDSRKGWFDEGTTVLPGFAICRIDSMAKQRHGQTLSKWLQSIVFRFQAQNRLYIFWVHRAYHPRIQESDLVCLPVDRVLALDLSKVNAISVLFSVLDQQVEAKERVFVRISWSVLTAIQSFLVGVRDSI